jgi:DNA-binding NtrC family response regulator
MLAERIGKDALAAADAEAPCKLLIADDQPHILEALRLLLKPEGYQLEMVRMPALVLEALAHESFDGLLIDLNYTRDTTSGQEGLDLVTRVKEMDAQLPVVVMTAWGNIDLAVEAMRRGAGDFIQKPWENARLLSILRTQMELHRSQKRTQWLEAENRILRAPGAPDFIASAPAMRPVLETMARVGPSDANVLITGEHGTGKEVWRRPCIAYRRGWIGHW